MTDEQGSGKPGKISVYYGSHAMSKNRNLPLRRFEDSTERKSAPVTTIQ
jgi:hypothetical protein